MNWWDKPGKSPKYPVKAGKKKKVKLSDMIKKGYPEDMDMTKPVRIMRGRANNPTLKKAAKTAAKRIMKQQSSKKAKVDDLVNRPGGKLNTDDLVNRPRDKAKAGYLKNNVDKEAIRNRLRKKGYKFKDSYINKLINSYNKRRYKQDRIK